MWSLKNIKMDEKEIEFLLKKISKETYMNSSNIFNIPVLTEQDIQNIIDYLPDLSNESYLESSENIEIFEIKEIIPNFLKYLLAPILVCTIFLIFSIRHFQNNVSNSKITFVLYHPKARMVEIVGDFTEWKPVKLIKKDRGVWYINFRLKPGKYRYIYIIDNQPYLDPQRDVVEDTFGIKNSIIYI